MKAKQTLLLKNPPVCLISIWLSYLRITVLFQRGWHYTNNTAVSPFVFLKIYGKLVKT